MRFEDFQQLDPADAVRRLKVAYKRIFVEKKPFAEWDADKETQSQLDEATGQFKTGDAMWEYWEDHAQDHLPLALKVIERHDLAYGVLRRPTSSTPNNDDNSAERVVLFVVGYSPEQLALSIAVHILNGCRVFIPVSGRAWETVKKAVCRHLSEHLFFDENDAFSFGDVQPIDEDRAEHPAETFAAISNWIRKHRDKMSAIDCTGGQKPMDAGAIQAASYWDVPAYYVHFKSYDSKYRRPKPHSCQYKNIDVPESSFSLEKRRQIRTRFMSRDFVAARSLIVPLCDEFENTAAKPDGVAVMRTKLGDDLHAFQNVRSLIEKSHHWAHLRYNEQILADHSPELHGFFENFEAKQRDPNSGGNRSRKALHRVLMETLLSADYQKELLNYIVDEYWRLTEMLAIDQVRDVQIGVVGLIELIMDALLVVAWQSDTKVSNVTSARFTKAKDAPADRSLAIAQEKLQDVHFPVACFPPGNQEAKRSVLKDGNCRFYVRLLADDKGAPSLQRHEADEHKSNPYWELQVELSTSRRYLVTRHSKSSKASLWRSFWGAYPGNYKEGEWNVNWVQFRHDIAHMRAPFFDNRHREFLGTHVLGTFLPHFIELVFLANGFHHNSSGHIPTQLHFVRDGQPAPKLELPGAEVRFVGRTRDNTSDGPAWDLAWLQSEQLSRQSRVPWLDPIANIDEWLSLPPESTE